MLTLFFRDENKDLQLDAISDIEMAFKKVRLTGTEDEINVMQMIDGATYNDSESFVDRFGYKLHLSELSTGCKAALVVIHNPDKIVNIIECGFNARDVIISFCKNGAILLDDDGVTYQKYSDNIEVRVDDYVFTNVDRLNAYINEERPFGISAGWEGVRYV